MRKSIVSNVAAMMMFMAANDGATAPAEGGANQETPVNVTPDGKPEEAPKGEGEKGKIGKVDAEALAEAERRQKLIDDLLAKKAAIVVPADHNSEEFKALVAEMSRHAKESGDGIKAANTSSAEAWPLMEALAPMTLNEKTGKMDIAKFLNNQWDMMLPEVKLVNPLAKKVGAFFSWNEARIRGNSAAMLLENVRNYIRNNGEKLYPAFHPKEAPASPEAVKAAEVVATFQKAKRAVDAVLDLKYLPTTLFVALDENGAPAEGEKGRTLAEILRAFEKENILPHIPAKEAEKEKAAKAAEAQTAAELEAQRKEIEEERAQLKKEKEELENAKKEAEKERKAALLEAKRAEGGEGEAKGHKAKK